MAGCNIVKEEGKEKREKKRLLTVADDVADSARATADLLVQVGACAVVDRARVQPLANRIPTHNRI